MSAETVSLERLAMLVHNYREALAPDFGCRLSPNPEWKNLSQDERNRMIAATRLALLDLRDDSVQGSPGVPPLVQGLAGGTEGKECGC
jgi:hypothetical protein